MRLLIIDPFGDALDFSYRAKSAGHKVKHFIRANDPKAEYIGLGLVDVVRDFQPWLAWADLIFNADNTKYLRELDAFRKTGCPIIGPSQETAEWETKRTLGMDVLRKHGVDCPPYVEFNDYDSAIAYVKKRKVRLVSKPNGDADKSLSYVAKTPADLVYMLERWKRAGKLKSSFILQDFVAGVEMGVGGWFGPHGFNAGWEENWEFKKLMDGDMGVATGEQGTVIRYVRRSKLAKMVLEPLAETLADLGYVGDIDVNCIIDEEGNPWPLEFTMRPGYPTFSIEQELRQGDPVEWLAMLAEGQDARNILMDTIALGVVLSIPDYPYSHLTRKEVLGVPIYGLTPRLMEHVHFGQVMMGKAPVDHGGEVVNEPIPVTAGDYVLIMTATGPTVYDAKQTAYRRLKKLTVPNSPMYRTDIGDRLSKQLPRIQSHGFAAGMEFSTDQAP